MQSYVQMTTGTSQYVRLYTNKIGMAYREQHQQPWECVNKLQYL